MIIIIIKNIGNKIISFKIILVLVCNDAMTLNTQQMAAAYSMADKAQSHAAVHLLINYLI